MLKEFRGTGRSQVVVTFVCCIKKHQFYFSYVFQAREEREFGSGAVYKRIEFV
jgi:hypothetical protein